MILLYILVGIIADLYLFFWLYVASMGVLRARAEGKLNNTLWAMSVPLLLFSLLVDFLNNITVFAILFWSIPREWLVTQRLKKHVNANTWRGAEARWFGLTLLNPFDHSGDHLD